MVELLRLVRAHTTDDILEIVSMGDEAEIQVGTVTKGTLQAERFLCCKKGEGWQTTERFKSLV